MAFSAIGRLSRTLKRIEQTRYPGFIFGLPLAKGDIPAFIYHDVDPVAFSEDLSFLRDNGYETLSTAAFIAEQEYPTGKKAVLLTFDDALQNFWEVAFPLLQKFDARVTLFAPSGWMRDSREGRPRLQAVPSGLGKRFMTWEELRICGRSGHVDVQSHAHRHALVYTAWEWVDFASPALLSRYHLYDWPMRHEAGEDRLGHPPLGTPIFRAMPLLSAPHRILEDEAAVSACRREVEKGGGVRFFERTDWRKRLHACLSPYLSREVKTVPGEAFRRLLASEFEEAKRAFEEELEKPITYLAYPWMLGSALSLELARDAGIEAVFGVGIDFKRIERMAGPLPAFGRLKGEWLRFLPGKGRRRLYQVLPEKLEHIIRAQHLAH